MEMRFFWVRNKEAQNIYEICWHLGQENLEDYQSSTTQGLTTEMYTPGLYTKKTPQGFYPGWLPLAL